MGFLQNLGNAFSQGVESIGSALNNVLGGVGGIVQDVGSSGILDTEAANTLATGLTGGLAGGLGGLGNVIGMGQGQTKNDPATDEPFYKKGWFWGLVGGGIAIITTIIVVVIRNKKGGKL